jgi:hypothetical protein
MTALSQTHHTAALGQAHHTAALGPATPPHTIAQDRDRLVTRVQNLLHLG